MTLKMEQVVSLCKRRGIIFPSSEIYGGFANSYSYGPYGTLLKNNIKALWLKKFVQEREDMVAIDGPILLHPKLWEASGHLQGFNDAMVDCKDCKNRFRADHLVEAATGEDMEGRLEDMTNILKEKKVKCPHCGKSNWTDVRNFNMMFKTEMNGINEPVYLRPETAGAIFVEFKNIIDTMRVKIPFGIAQIGKAFRNEIIAGNFIFRLRELEQMEIEYFFDPTFDWEPIFEKWLSDQQDFVYSLGVKKEETQLKEHAKEKLSHYSKRTVDIYYNFPFGMSELTGIAYRTDFDLSQHSKYSGVNLEYYDQANDKRFIPHVIEPTWGLDRAILATLCSAFEEEKVNEEETRTVLKFPKYLAPIKIAIFPLLKNRPELVEKARDIYESLKKNFMCEFDDNGNIGKRYRRQDEIGTPYCITFDFDSLTDNCVTIRDRDTMGQERVKIDKLEEYFAEKF